MPHNIIFIVGTPRTGTSILVKCLEKSGYNIGKQMLGHKYKSQNTVFRKVNRQVKELLIKQLLETKPSANNPIVIGEPIRDTINEFWKYATLYNIEVLKDPLFYEIFGVWWNVSNIFRNQKFIWTHRDPVETAKSAVRLKYINNVPPGEPYASYTVSGRLERGYAYNNIHDAYFPKCESINVYFEELLNDTHKVQREMSAFLGRDFDVSLVNKDETFAAKGEPQ